MTDPSRPSILHVITSLSSGGAEKLVLDLSRNYVSKGCRTAVLSLSNRNSHLVERLLDEGDIEYYCPGKARSVYNPLHIFYLPRIMKEFDVVHVHLFPAFYWAGIASLINRPDYLVYTEHNTSNRRRGNFFSKLADSLIYSLYDGVITISDAVDANLKAHVRGFFQSDIHKIYNGIDLGEIERAEPLPRASLGLKPGEKLILQVASFTPQKNQAFLIRSLVHLPEAYKVFFAGDGPEREACESLAQELGLEDRVAFLGIRPDVPALLKTADTVVLASHFEGLSLSSVEGMASGAPFLASEVPGLTEVVQGAGILFSNEDAAGLAEKVIRAVEDVAHRELVIQNCRKRAKRYDQTDMAAAYLHLYSKNLLKSLAYSPKKIMR